MEEELVLRVGIIDVSTGVLGWVMDELMVS